ncbi:MAG: right-handed parallel beta-helix repeat-containing protein [Solirubrobacterales bacterium]
MLRLISVLTAGFIIFSIFVGFSSGTAGASQIWVDPIRGSDSAAGSQVAPLRSLNQAWRRVPASNARTEIILAAGDYRELSPNYWENKRGRITVRANGAATLPAVNIFRVGGLSFRGIEFRGDIHCELCTGFSLINVRANLTGAWEVIKINQSRGITIRNSHFSGAGDNVLDLVAVQRARIFANSFRDAGDWCGYVKGGSTDIVVRDNLFRDCGTGGFTVGQGTGFQFMTAPFLHYEANGVVVARNTVINAAGAGFGVNGGYNVLFLDNVAFGVGQRSHLVEAVFGLRSCDGSPEMNDPVRLRCARFLRTGGWGTTRIDSVDGGVVSIPNRNVFFIGNIFSSPTNTWTGDQAFMSLRGPIGSQPGSGVPGGASGDTRLVFRRNIFWTQPAEMELGLGTACQSDNPSCNSGQLRRDNLFNRWQPGLRTASSGHLIPTGAAASYRSRRVAPAPDWRQLPSGRPPWKNWPLANLR